MARLFKQMFTWWNGSTFSMHLYTWCKGKRIGQDEAGNIYYQGGITKEGRPRRWVIYKNYSEASSIPPGWHGWIHYRVDVPPCEENYHPHPWEKRHQPNLTGTAAAYRPQGSISHNGQRRKVAGDYEAWKPED